MSKIILLLSLLYREYLRTRLEEMKALPHFPPGK